MHGVINCVVMSREIFFDRESIGCLFVYSDLLFLLTLLEKTVFNCHFVFLIRLWPNDL